MPSKKTPANLDLLCTQHLLIALARNSERHQDDLMDALQFSDDLRYPVHMTSREIVQSIRAHMGYYSDSTVNDLLEILDELYPEGN